MDKKASDLLSKAFTAPVRKRHYFHSCVACHEDRVDGAFCQKHKEEYEKSPWVKAFRAYQKECARVGVKNAIWSPPKPKKEVKK